MRMQASLQSSMKISRSTEMSSQLSESFVHQLQLHGVPANNLASSKNEVLAMDMTFNVQDLSPEIYYLQNKEGDTQLHLSLILEKFDVSELLISIAPNSSYLDIANDEGLTALHYAVMAGECQIVRKLVLAGANTQARTNQGEMAIHLAAKGRHLNCIKALTDALSSSEKELLGRSNIPKPLPQLRDHIDARNYIGQSALHIAACNNFLEVVHQLLLAGANVNAKEGLGGRTALHLAIEKDNDEVVHYLAQIATTLDATMYSGKAAYQIALECSPHYAEAFLRYGAAPVIRDHYDDSMSEDNNSSSDEEYSIHSYMEYIDSYSNKFVSI